MNIVSRVASMKLKACNTQARGTHRNNGAVSRSAVFGKPLAKAAKSDAGSLLDDGLRILESGIDDGPELVDVRSDKFGATLDGHTKSHEGRLPGRGIGRSHVGGDVSVEGREDLSGRESLRQNVEDSESEL